MTMDFDADAADMFDTDEFATDALYAAGGTPPTVAVKILIDEGVQRLGFESNQATSHTEVTFRDSEITAPARGDTLEYGAGPSSLTLVTEIVDDGIVSVWIAS